MKSRPPDDGSAAKGGSPGGRALSAQSPTGTVMGLLARRRSLAGKLGWHCPSATWGSGLGCRQSPTFARARGCSELHCAPSQSDCEVGFLAVNVGIVKTRFLVVLLRSGGAKSINRQYLQAAQSMGASQRDIFRRIVLPATLPSIVVGSAVGMGITWEVVVAAEMISGGGAGGGASGGLGFFIWSSYVGGSYEQIIVGMISIGIAGYISSELLRKLGGRFTPWLKTR